MRKNSDALPFIAQKVPDLDYLSAFFYEDLVRKLRPTDFETWCSAFKEHCEMRIFELTEPYLEEVYCRGKAICIGYELRESGVWSFSKWNSCLLAQLNSRERTMIAPFSQQIYKQAKAMMEENTGVKGGILREGQS